MQNFNKKIKSAKGKALTLLEAGAEPLFEGRFNFENTNNEIELLAIKRTTICLGCEFYEDEHLESFKITDEKIPELSGKMCGECFCILAYKLRQSKIKCDKWQE